MALVTGRYAFEIDGEKIEAEAGRFVPVPKGGLHTFRNISAAPSRLITITWPGTIHEAFFYEVGIPLARGATEFPTDLPPPDIPAVLAKAASLGMEFVKH